jgi:hypothetical protein
MQHRRRAVQASHSGSSQWGEPTTDRLCDLGGVERSPRESPILALEAPHASSTPVPTSGDDDRPSASLLDSEGDSRSKAMSLD